MKILPDDKYKNKLIELWIKVFGDERDYIELLFPENKCICDVFAVAYGETLCSALYLLDCTLNYKGSAYKGKYLYAAATDPQFRGKGLMASLITEAEQYCKASGIDFISLVPADEGLYGYYNKFGFVEAMHRRCITVPKDISCENAVEIKADEYFSLRDDRLKGFINFSSVSVAYASDCLRYSGSEFYKCGDFLFIKEKGSKLYDEVLFDGFAATLTVDSSVGSEINETEKYGMLYPLNPELKRDWKITDIYMNIALD